MLGRKLRICKCMRQQNETDWEIVSRILRGRQRGDYALLVNRYGTRLFAFVATMVTRREDAEELAHDCFLRAFRQLVDGSRPLSALSDSAPLLSACSSIPTAPSLPRQQTSTMPYKE